jgi:hypothetical protein
LVLGTATLPDYEFVADLRGFISARPKSGSKLFGVLYEADQQCMGFCVHGLPSTCAASGGFALNGSPFRTAAGGVLIGRA